MMAMLAPMSTITDTATLMPAVVRWLLMIIVAIMTRKVMRMRLVPEGDWHDGGQYDFRISQVLYPRGLRSRPEVRLQNRGHLLGGAGSQCIFGYQNAAGPPIMRMTQREGERERETETERGVRIVQKERNKSNTTAKRACSEGVLCAGILQALVM